MKTLTWHKFSEIQESFLGGTVELVFEIPQILGNFFDPHPNVNYSVKPGGEQVYRGIVKNISTDSRNFPLILIANVREFKRDRWKLTSSLNVTEPISLHQSTFHRLEEQESPIQNSDGTVQYHVFFGRHCTLYPQGFPVPIKLPRPMSIEKFEGIIEKLGMTSAEFVRQAILSAEMVTRRN